MVLTAKVGLESLISAIVLTSRNICPLPWGIKQIIHLIQSLNVSQILQDSYNLLVLLAVEVQHFKLHILSFCFGGTFSNVICQLIQSKGENCGFPGKNHLTPKELGKSGCSPLAGNTTKHYGTSFRHCNNYHLSCGDKPSGRALVHMWILSSTEN